MMNVSEIKQLAEDIKANGLQSPIILYEDKILDGRNRCAACEMYGIDPVYENYKGNDPLKYIVSTNMHRRHLTESQRAVVAEKIANIQNGEFVGNQHVSRGAPIGAPQIDTPNSHKPKVTQREAADMMNVSRRAVQRVKEIKKTKPELINKIESGEITVNKALKEAKDMVSSDNVTNKKTRLPPINKSTAHLYARSAIHQLSQIKDNDKEIVPALNLVLEYINNKLTESEG